MATISENDSGFFNGTFKDIDGNALVPKTATWSLSDQNGTVLDSGNITPISSTYEFVISSIKILNSRLLKRFVMVSITYDSGSSIDLIKNEETTFTVRDLKNIVTP